MNVLLDKPLSRRTVLQGLGASIVLPWLEAMAPRSVLAASNTGQHPVRMAFLYVPNGMQMEHWTPKTEGPNFELPQSLKPLVPLRDDLLVLSGLASLEGRPYNDNGNHAPAVGSYLTGTHPSKSVRCGISADQAAARHIGHQTRLPSLQIGPEPGGKRSCDKYPCSVVYTLSWRTPTQPLPTQTSPKAIFDQLFGSAISTDKQRNDVRRSILDTVREEAQSLRQKISAHDRHKLEEYLTSVRDIEQRIVRAESTPPPKLPQGVTPPVDREPDTFADKIRLLGDLMVLAFQSDATRVCSFIFDYEGSDRPYAELGINKGHHYLSHRGGDDWLDNILKIEHYHLTQFAYVLQRLKSIREGDGTLLDNCMISYGCSLGDGMRHDHADLPILLAGKGGGTIQTGRHIRYPNNTPLANLWLAMLDRAGVPARRLGDSTGRLAKLS